jgi:uncharacterized protein YbcI
VITFLEDLYTPIERTLIDAGDHETVRTTRLAFQRAMEDKFVGAVEEVMGRKVIAFLSQVHFNPDISQETFVLEPQAATPRPKAEAPIAPVCTLGLPGGHEHGPRSRGE